jgi:hypothetical protein
MPHWLPPIFHGTLREHYLLLFGAAGALGLLVSLVSAWLGAQFGARCAVRNALRDVGVPLAPAVEARFERLGQAVDAIALDVERIAEAQRFTAKLLVERATDGVPATRPPRREVGEITPH